jgi:hypothetical protein
MKRSVRRRGDGLVLFAAIALAGLGLAGCSIPMADLPGIGLPAGAPARGADPAVYPAVHDMPAARTTPVLDPDEQTRIESDLKSARDRQAGVSGQSIKPLEPRSSDARSSAAKSTDSAASER